MLEGRSLLSLSKLTRHIGGSLEIKRSECSDWKGEVLYSRQFIAFMLKSGLSWKMDALDQRTPTPVGVAGAEASPDVVLVARPMRVSPTANRSK